MDKNIFSKRLKELREKKNITKTDLAEKIGCDQPKLSKLENPENKVHPSVDDLINIANYFGVSVDYLLGIEKKQPNEVRTFADIIQKLFDIDEATHISIQQNNIEYTEEDDYGFPETYCKTFYQLCFEKHGNYKLYLNDFMKEWKDIKDLSKSTNYDFWNKMYKLWKDDQLERASQKPITIWDGFTNIPDGIDEELPFF